jgi:hypothetical protein
LTLGHVISIRNRHVINVRVIDNVLTLLAILLLDVCGELDLDPAPDGDDALLHLHHDRHQQEVVPSREKTYIEHRAGKAARLAS